MNFEDVDPSLAVGFLLKTREEFFKFIDFYYKVRPIINNISVSSH